MTTAFHSNHDAASKALQRAHFWDKIVRIITLGIINRSKQVKEAEILEYKRHRELKDYLFNTNYYEKKRGIINNIAVDGTNKTDVVPLNPITAGGDDYGSEWEQLKKPALERDGYICQELSADCHGPLHVHHIIPLSRGGSNSEDNLITLCEYHHSQKHPHMQG